MGEAMLDIEGLRLTHEERTEAFAAKYGAVSEVAKAQLAKALYGYLDYLETVWREGTEPQWEIRGLWLALLRDLEQANIERPSAIA